MRGFFILSFFQITLNLKIPNSCLHKKFWIVIWIYFLCREQIGRCSRTAQFLNTALLVCIWSQKFFFWGKSSLHFCWWLMLSILQILLK